MDHIQDMFEHTLKPKQMPFKFVLMDTGYTSNKMMLSISDAEKIFYCPVKKIG